MKILITGATGFVGKPLCQTLAQQGHELVILTRNPQAAFIQVPAPHTAIAWNETTEELSFSDGEHLKGIQAIIHLAGESIASSRWNEPDQERILHSRVKGTESVIRLLKKYGQTPPRVFISASAVGFYGDQGDTLLNEKSSGGGDFLAQVCQKWESALLEADLQSTRKICLRLGVVLGKGGGALEKMLPPFLSGVGATLGSGRQWMSWIHIQDLIQIFLHALEDERYEGIINACSPQAVTQKEFSQTLAQVLHTWNLFKAPAPILRLTLGKMAQILLSSQRVSPQKLEELGFQFQYEDLSSALLHLLGHSYSRGYSEFLSSCWIPQPIEKVFPFFAKAENLELITPPWLNFRILSHSTPEIQAGTLIDYQLKLHGIPLRWRTEISDWNPPLQFTDTQLKGPYRLWKHTHRFQSLQGGTLMEDEVLYQLPLGKLGRITAGSFVLRDVQSIFNYRSKRIFELLT